MRIGVVGDSHDNVPMIRRAVERLRKERVGAVCHLGDFVAPFAVKEWLKLDLPLHAIYGNNDGERAGLKKLLPEIADPPHAVDLGGKRFVLAHDRDRLGDVNGDVILFAHTHEATVDPGPPLRVNPGEVGGWLTDRPTLAVIETDPLGAKIIEIGEQ